MGIDVVKRGRRVGSTTRTRHNVGITEPFTDPRALQVVRVDLTHQDVSDLLVAVRRQHNAAVAVRFSVGGPGVPGHRERVNRLKRLVKHLERVLAEVGL